MYEIQFYPTREPEFDAEVTLHGHGVVKQIEDLMPNTYYTFKLRAIMAHDRAHTDWTTSSYTTGLYFRGKKYPFLKMPICEN